MNLEGWLSDTEKLVSQLPPNTPIRNRAEHLLYNISPGGIEVDVDHFGSLTSIDLPDQSFLIVNRLKLSNTDSNLGELARTLNAVAFVAGGENLPTVLVLPDRDQKQSIGHAAIFLHELEHISEDEDGVSHAPSGFKERRAYATNTEIISAYDGSDFDKYVNNWPVDFTSAPIPIASRIGNGSVSMSFNDIPCPKPPKDTYAYDMWSEGETSRQILQSIGRSAVFERLTTGLNKKTVDSLADDFHSLSL